MAWVWCARRNHFTVANAMATPMVCKVCKAQHVIFDKRTRERNRAFLRAMHTPCVECKENRLFWLEFAHFNRAEKSKALNATPSIRRITQELDCVRSLCVACHSAETLRENAALGHKPARSDPVYDYFLFRYGGRCQCGQPECDVYMDKATPRYLRHLIEWDHQPQFHKTSEIANLKWRNNKRRKGPLISERLWNELKKCLPLFRPHHRIITYYRLRVDPMYRAGVPLPLEWRNLFSKPTTTSSPSPTPLPPPRSPSPLPRPLVVSSSVFLAGGANVPP
jgi:hypothetical protein